MLEFQKLYKGGVPMTYRIHEASPQALAKITDEARKSAVPADTSNADKKLKLPFDFLQIGECFCVPFDEASESSLRVTSTNKGKKLQRKFTVIRHKNYACFEVARIA